MAQLVKNLPATQETWVRSLGQEDPWRREWLPTLVFLPRESYGQRSLEVYSPWGCKELDTTEQPTHTHTHTHTQDTEMAPNALKNCFNAESDAQREELGRASGLALSGATDQPQK